MTRFREIHGIFWTLKALARIALALAGLLAMVALAPYHAFAQGTRKDDIVFNSRGVPLAGAQVRVCVMPASGQPCSPLALIYSDAALTQALSNPTSTDGLGNYFFYAAPGKYEVEISGPGITTKQIPNVILPSDPSAPTFTTLTTTSGISAFSLTLTGNLTVNGSASVIGNLAGSAFTLSNQATPPGAPSAGLVNLYTKAADKRLYYKDDTGTEIGPIANTSGAQTNVANIFTAPQNFDVGFASKGPSPWVDITRYGGTALVYPPQTTTGSMSAASTTLTLAGAIDFQNGQGIVVYKAGPATTLQTPVAPTVASVGILNGATTYNYQVVGEDFNGGLTPASPTGTLTTGAATLGATSVSLTSAARSGGVLTFTTSATHNLQAGVTVSITGAQFSGSASAECNGTLVINTVPTGTTFTVNQGGRPDNAAVCTSGTATVLAGNRVTWFTSAGGGNPSVTTQNNTMRWWIYRNNALVGVASGPDTYYVDFGYGLSSPMVNALTYVPSAPPASATPGWLATTITAGGGTTTLTLAVAATTTATSQTVLHDSAPAILAAVNAAIANGGGTVYLPPAAESGNQITYLINSALVLPNSSSNYVRLVFNGGVEQSQPIVMNSNYSIEGIPGSGSFNQVPAFGTSTYSIFGGVTPAFIQMTCKFGVSFKGFAIVANQNQQVGILLSGNGAPCGNTQIAYTDTYVGTSGNGSEPLRDVGGGFGRYFKRGGMTQGQTSNAALALPGIHFSTMNVQQSSGQIAGAVYVESTFMDQQGVRVDTDPSTGGTAAGGSQYSIQNLFYESVQGPILRVGPGLGILSSYSVVNVNAADQASGAATPMIDLTGAFQLFGFFVSGVNGFTSLFAAGVPSNNIGATIVNVPLSTFASLGLSTSYELVNSGSIGVGGRSNTGTGAYKENALTTVMKDNPSFVWPLAIPSAPAATVQAGGSLAVGTYFYFLAALDVDGLANIGAGDTPVSSASNSCTTSGGNQKCALTWSTVPGAAGYRLWRGTCAPIFCIGGYVIIAGGSAASFTDDGTSTFNGASLSNVNNAGFVKLRQSGIVLNGENFSAVPRDIFSAFLPGALTSTWTGATLTLDKAITVTRVQVQAKTAPSGCATNAVVRLTDGASPLNVTLSAAANDSGAVSQNYAAGAVLTISVQTAASGCTTSPADANVAVQYRMQ
jgi:hypothetical protein